MLTKINKVSLGIIQQCNRHKPLLLTRYLCSGSMSSRTRRFQPLRRSYGQLGTKNPRVVHIAFRRHRKPLRYHRDLNISLSSHSFQVSHV